MDSHAPMTPDRFDSADIDAARRELARRRLVDFAQYTNPLYRPAGHHRRICEKLEAVERGEIDRLMIFMPPRHGKSELASKRFPAWCLGRDPQRQIIGASYNSDLATDFGRNVRNIVAEREFAEVFPNVALAPDSRAANRLNTNHGGAYVAAGVGTAVTGRGADIALISEPSTYAGFAAIAGSIRLSAPLYSAISAVAVAVAGLVAVVLHEKKPAA